MTEDWFIERLGRAQQKVMALVIENRRLKQRVEKLESQLREAGHAE